MRISTIVLPLLTLTLSAPRSPLMPSKQQEMDQVVERIYRDLERRDAEDGQRSLLVLVGDHGMTEVSGEYASYRLRCLLTAALKGGNHGGSTEAETSAVRIANQSFSSGTLT